MGEICYNENNVNVNNVNKTHNLKAKNKKCFHNNLKAKNKKMVSPNAIKALLYFGQFAFSQ